MSKQSSKNNLQMSKVRVRESQRGFGNIVHALEGGSSSHIKPKVKLSSMLTHGKSKSMENKFKNNKG